jgi:hypothetical protein
LDEGRQRSIGSTPQWRFTVIGHITNKLRSMACGRQHPPRRSLVVRRNIHIAAGALWRDNRANTNELSYIHQMYNHLTRLRRVYLTITSVDPCHSIARLTFLVDVFACCIPNTMGMRISDHFRPAIRLQTTCTPYKCYANPSTVYAAATVAIQRSILREIVRRGCSNRPAAGQQGNTKTP